MNPYEEFKAKMRREAEAMDKRMGPRPRMTYDPNVYRDQYRQRNNPLQDYLDEVMRRAQAEQARAQAAYIPRAPDWCKVLDLPATATKDQIKAQYRKLVKINHPDAGGDPAKFHQIQTAYKEATNV